MPIIVLSLTYWIALLIMGPVTIFILGVDGPTGISSVVGVVVFWLIVLIGIILSFILMKNKDPTNWYQNVFLYGAYQLGFEVVRRSDETMQGDQTWWAQPFIFWWGCSIKYFVPFAVWNLMMWNFRLDLQAKQVGQTDVYRYYGGYHPFWQLMGFIYPLIGLLCFFIPVCCPPDVVTGKRLDDFAKESDAEFEA